MSNHLFFFIFGIGFGFLLNFPPKKVQYVVLGILVTLWIAGFAYLLDTGQGLPPIDLVNIAFNLLGYAIGWVTSWATKTAIGVNWE